jgi:uncharacterized membrane protein YgcG
MSRYGDDLERRIRVKRLVDAWRRSALLDEAQQPRLISELRDDMRRTNRYLRVTLLAFGLLIIGAAVVLAAITLHVNRERSAGLLLVAAACACVTIAEVLIVRFRLYRFGIEEACAIGAVVLGACGTVLTTTNALFNRRAAVVDRPAFVGLMIGSALAFAAYRRYGYLYGAFAAMLCAGFLPFQVALPQHTQRLLAAGIFGACLLAGRFKRRQYGDEFPGDGYGYIQAAASVAVYAALNLHLDFGLAMRSDPSWFKWLTYAIIWLLPAAGLWLSVRDRDRPLLDASLLMTMATLVTNKPYLGLAHKPWDPILFGLVLIGAAVVLRRWLASGPDGSRSGFTPTRILRSDNDALAATGIVSAALGHGAAQRHSGPSSPDPFEGGGGRSGGGGAGASF